MASGGSSKKKARMSNGSSFLDKMAPVGVKTEPTEEHDREEDADLVSHLDVEEDADLVSKMDLDDVKPLSKSVNSCHQLELNNSVTRYGLEKIPLTPSQLREIWDFDNQCGHQIMGAPLRRGTCKESDTVTQGLRMIEGLIEDVRRDLAEKLRSVEQMQKTAAESLQKILSCVLPPLETNIAEGIPRLPLEDRDSEKKLNDLMKQKEHFNKVVTFIYGLGGTSARDAVYLALKTLMTDDFASTKSMKGIRRSGKPAKEAFMGTPLFKAVMCAVRRRFKTATVSDVMEMTGSWLKDAPAREKKRQRRKENREQMLHDYEMDETDDQTNDLVDVS